MARFSFEPLSAVTPSTLHKAEDKLIVASFDSQTGLATLVVGQYDPKVTIKAVWSKGRWESVKVECPARKPNVHLVGRTNRLMSGFAEWPGIETYNRGGNSPLNGKVVVRMPGQPVPLPATIFGANMAHDQWDWALTGAPAAPVAPTVSPTPPPTPPAPAPKVAPNPAQAATPSTRADDPADKPAPKPAPKADRKAPIKVSTTKHDPNGLLRFPSKATTNDIIVDPVMAKRLSAFMARHFSPTREGMSAALFTGPAGTGKTQMVDSIAAQHGLGVFDANAMGYVDFTDWTGRTGIDKDGTRFIWNPLIDIIRADGPYKGQTLIVKVDEFNRTPSTTAGNFWLPVIEEGRVPVPEAGETIDVNPNVIFIFTVNEGAGYGGTVDIDTALRDRMDSNVRLEYLSRDAEVRLITDRWGKATGITKRQAEQVVIAATQVRSMAAQREVRSGISTRNILKAVEQTQYGLSLNEACHAIWTDSYPDEAQRERVTTAINASIPAA